MNRERISILLYPREIEKLVGRISNRIIEDVIKENISEVNFVTVLEGARKFSRELRRELLCQNRALFEIRNYEVKISSYCGTTSGDLRLKKGIEANLSGKSIIVVEDIVDSGKTMQFLKNYLLKEKQAADVKIASLLSKPSRRQVNVKINYLGKEIPDVFVVGYGLDKDGKYRGLDYIGRIDE